MGVRVVGVGCCSLEMRLLLVFMAGGAVIMALAVVLDLVLAEGGSVGSGWVLALATLLRR